MSSENACHPLSEKLPLALRGALRLQHGLQSILTMTPS